MNRPLSTVLLFLLLLSGCKDIQRNDPNDESFDAFFRRFNKDSVFQMSRINFPLTVEEFDMDALQPKKITIQRADYHIIDLSYHKSFSERELDKYSQEVKVKGDKATIEIRGIDNGIHNDVFFEKVNGQWTLISYTDSST